MKECGQMTEENDVQQTLAPWVCCLIQMSVSSLLTEIHRNEPKLLVTPAITTLFSITSVLTSSASLINSSKAKLANSVIFVFHFDSMQNWKRACARVRAYARITS